MSKEQKLLNPQTHAIKAEELKKFLITLLPRVIVEIISHYEEVSYFLKTATTYPGIFKLLGKFFLLKELAGFFSINTNMRQITSKLVHEYYNYTFRMAPQHPHFGAVDIVSYYGDAIVDGTLNGTDFFHLKMLIIANILNANSIIDDEPLIVHAVRKNSCAAVNFLLDNNAEIKSAKSEENDNLMIFAFKLGHIDIVKMLSAYFAPLAPDLRCRSNNTLLMHAIADGDIKWITELLPRHLPKNNSNELINMAVMKKSYKITRLLLENKAEIKLGSQNCFSPLQTFVRRCDQTSFEMQGHEPVTILQDFKMINRMFMLLLKHGDSVLNIPNSEVRRIFCNLEPVLARVIISHGGSADEINPLDILVKLDKITNYLAQAKDWDTLFYWLNFLKQKLSNIEMDFTQRLEQAVATYAGSLVDLNLFTSKNLSPSKYFLKMWHISRDIIKNAQTAQEDKDWSHVQFHTDDLAKSTRKYLMAIWYEHKESKMSFSRRTSDASDLEDLHEDDNKNSVLEQRTLAPSTYNNL